MIPWHSIQLLNSYYVSFRRTPWIFSQLFAFSWPQSNQDPYLVVRQRKTSSPSVRQVRDIAAGHREDYWSILILDKVDAMDVNEIWDCLSFSSRWCVKRWCWFAGAAKGNWNHQLGSYWEWMTEKFPWIRIQLIVIIVRGICPLLLLVVFFKNCVRWPVTGDHVCRPFIAAKLSWTNMGIFSKMRGDLITDSMLIITRALYATDYMSMSMNLPISVCIYLSNLMQ